MTRTPQGNKKQYWAAVAAMALLAAASTGLISTQAASKTKPEAAIQSARSLSEAFRNSAKSVLPTVVSIRATPAVSQITQHKNPSFGELPFGEFRNHPELRRFFKDWPSMPKKYRGGIGSGVIIDSSGIILTNHHVVDVDGTVTVRLHDGREFEAVEVKSDPKTDLAVVRIEAADDLPAAPLGDSDATQIGDWVLALGQPFGLEGTVTSGIISAKGRGIGIADRENFLQTDAAINPGNSGGPLVNLNGEVIGINTAISSSSGGNQGIGFAVPIKLAKWVSDQLIDGGTVHRAQLGVMIQELTHSLAKKFDVESRGGVVVTDVQPDSAADRAGLKAGDVIVEFAGKKVSSPRELQNAVERSEIGNDYSITLLRDSKRMTLTAELGEAASKTPDAKDKKDEQEVGKLGLGVGPLNEDAAKQLGMDSTGGVLITSVQTGSPADQAGLKAGLVVTEVNRTPVENVTEFNEILADSSDEEGVLLLLRSAQGSRYVVLLPKA